MINFKVKKGKNFFWGPRWNFIGRNKKEFNVKVLFWDSCNYKLVDNSDQINKLTGQSFNIFPWYDKAEKKFRPGHHKNSVRFGWRCVDDSIEILAYAYIDGERRHKTISSIETGSWVHLNFKETDCYYVFIVVDDDGNSSIVKFKKNGTKKGFLGLFINRLYPYFGGKISAPHDMGMTLKYLKRFI